MVFADFFVALQWNLHVSSSRLRQIFRECHPTHTLTIHPTPAPTMPCQSVYATQHACMSPRVRQPWFIQTFWCIQLEDFCIICLAHYVLCPQTTRRATRFMKNYHISFLGRMIHISVFFPSPFLKEILAWCWICPSVVGDFVSPSGASSRSPLFNKMCFVWCDE